MAPSGALGPPVLRPLAERLASVLDPGPGPVIDAPAAGAELAAALAGHGRGGRLALAVGDAGLPARGGVHSVRAQAAHPPVRAACTDLVASLLTVHAEPDPAATLRALATLLLPDGRIAVAGWAPGGAPHLIALGAALRAARGAALPAIAREVAFDPAAALQKAGLELLSDVEIADVVRFQGAAHLWGAHDGVAGADGLDAATVAAVLDDLGTRLLPVTVWDGTLVVPVRLRVVSARVPPPPGRGRG